MTSHVLYRQKYTYSKILPQKSDREQHPLNLQCFHAELERPKARRRVITSADSSEEIRH